MTDWAIDAPCISVAGAAGPWALVLLLAVGAIAVASFIKLIG